MVVAWVAITDCIISLPSALSTATEMVLWWTSRPIYLMLSIGCSFRQVWFTASHSNHNLLRKGRPFIMRAPLIRGVRMSGLRESHSSVRPITDGNDLPPIRSGHDERFGALVWWARPAFHNLKLLSAPSGSRQLGKSELSGMAAQDDVFRLAVPLIRNPRMSGTRLSRSIPNRCISSIPPGFL